MNHTTALTVRIAGGVAVTVIAGIGFGWDFTLMLLNCAGVAAIFLFKSMEDRLKVLEAEVKQLRGGELNRRARERSERGLHSGAARKVFGAAYDKLTADDLWKKNLGTANFCGRA